MKTRKEIRKMKVFKKLEMLHDGDGRKTYYNVVDIDISTGQYVGYYTVDMGGYELIIGGFSLSEAEKHLSLRPVR